MNTNVDTKLKMKEIIRKHEEIMQERFDEKYWFWIRPVDEYIEEMEDELNEDEFDDLTDRITGVGDYVLDRYAIDDIEVYETLEEAYFNAIDHNYGKLIFEEVIRELEREKEIEKKDKIKKDIVKKNIRRL